MKKKLVILSLGMLPLLAIHAQQDTTIVRTVVVENEYNPIVMDASKINVLPKVEDMTVPKANIDYANSIRPVRAWTYQAMQPIARDWNTNAVYRGYLHAGYGTHGNVDARLGYLWDISEKDRLNIKASLNGWNGNLAPVNEQDWESRLYNSRVGLDYRHTFTKMNLMLGGAYRSQVFNYVENKNYSDNEIYSSTKSFSDKQHQTLANAYMGLTSTDEDMKVQFEAEIGIKSFQEDYPVMSCEDVNKEANFYVQGDVWTQAKKGGRLGLDVRFDNYAYSSILAEDWMALELNPYFSTQNDDWKIRIGAHVDWTGGDYDKVYFSPDLKIEYVLSKGYVLFAKAEGGRETSSLYDLANMTPYFHNYSIKPSYVALDAALGLKASPSNGWWFLISGGYQIRKNDVCLYLNPATPFWSVDNIQGKNHAFWGTAELKYDYKDLLNFSLAATYYNWDAKDKDSQLSEIALSLKPELEINAKVGFRPMQGLWINVGYDYVKRCNDISGEPISHLFTEANYGLLKNLNVFIKVDNLFNKEYIAPYAYPAQKLNLLGGVSLRF